jgi:hypothetical protein
MVSFPGLKDASRAERDSRTAQAEAKAYFSRGLAIPCAKGKGRLNACPCRTKPKLNDG